MTGAKLPTATVGRRSFLRTSFAIAVAAPLLSACGALEPQAGAGGTAEQGKKFLLSFDALDIDFYVQWEKLGKEAAEELGLDYSKAVSNYDVSTQRAAFENAMTQGFDAVGMTAADEGASASLIKLLTDSGILVVNNGTNAPWSTPFDIGPNHISYMTPDNYLGAAAVARLLFTKMGGKGKLVHIEGVRGLSHDTERTLAVDAVLKEFPGIELVARQPGNYSRVDAQAATEDILNSRSDVKGIFVQNDDGALGVLNALRNYGSKVFVTGIDGMPEMLDKIGSGEALATWVQDPGYQAGTQAVLLYDALNGWKPRTPERMLMPGTFIIDTPESAKLYKEKMFGTGKAYDWKKMSKTLNPEGRDLQNLLIPINPEEFWARRKDEMPDGYVLAEEYAASKKSGEWDEVVTEYAEAFKTDPFKDVRAATNYGGAIIGQG